MTSYTTNTWATACAPRKARRQIATAAALLCAAHAAFAVEVDTGNGDLKLRWDNTIKYSAGFRLKERAPVLTADANLDDGDRNFDKGLISNRVDVLSEADLTYGNLGARVSGAAWYDAVYRHGTDNDSPYTYNAVSAPFSEFPAGTRKLHGRKGELLDAFVFAKHSFDDMPVSVRVGRHALVYGETLFYGANGIAAAQQPIDVVKALSVPGTQFKELIRPVGQVSGQIQLRSNLAVGAYWQYRWEKSRLPGAGSYFSGTDFLDDGGERLLTGPGSALLRGRDLEARNSGQGGMQVKWTPEGSDVDYGFYAARYHDKTPQVVIQPGMGTYALAYHENIRTFGVSASSTIGNVNLAGEVSIRRNAALANAGTPDLFGVVPVFAGGPAAPADNRDNTSYPVGNTAHANLSMLGTLGPSFIAREASLVGEVAWNRATSVTRHADLLDPNANRDAWGLRFTYEPGYRQVVPGLDLSVPIGLGYTPKGRSAALGPSFGQDKGGDISVGLNGVFESAWYLSVSVTHYYGKAAPATEQRGPLTVYTFLQNMKDRDFLSLSVRRTF